MAYLHGYEDRSGFDMPRYDLGVFIHSVPQHSGNILRRTLDFCLYKDPVVFGFQMPTVEETSAGHDLFSS